MAEGHGKNERLERGPWRQSLENQTTRLIRGFLNETAPENITIVSILPTAEEIVRSAYLYTQTESNIPFAEDIPNWVICGWESQNPPHISTYSAFVPNVDRFRTNIEEHKSEAVRLDQQLADPQLVNREEVETNLVSHQERASALEFLEQPEYRAYLVSRLLALSNELNAIALEKDNSVAFKRIKDEFGPDIQFKFFFLEEISDNLLIAANTWALTVSGILAFDQLVVAPAPASAPVSILAPTQSQTQPGIQFHTKTVTKQSKEVLKKIRTQIHGPPQAISPGISIPDSSNTSDTLEETPFFSNKEFKFTWTKGSRAPTVLPSIQESTTTTDKSIKSSYDILKAQIEEADANRAERARRRETDVPQMTPIAFPRGFSFGGTLGSGTTPVLPSGETDVSKMTPIVSQGFGFGGTSHTSGTPAFSKQTFIFGGTHGSSTLLPSSQQMTQTTAVPKQSVTSSVETSLNILKESMKELESIRAQRAMSQTTDRLGGQHTQIGQTLGQTTAGTQQELKTLALLREEMDHANAIRAISDQRGQTVRSEGQQTQINKPGGLMLQIDFSAIQMPQQQQPSQPPPPPPTGMPTTTALSQILVSQDAQGGRYSPSDLVMATYSDGSISSDSPKSSTSMTGAISKVISRYLTNYDRFMAGQPGHFNPILPTVPQLIMCYSQQAQGAPTVPRLDNYTELVESNELIALNNDSLRNEYLKRVQLLRELDNMDNRMLLVIDLLELCNNLLPVINGNQHNIGEQMVIDGKIQSVSSGLKNALKALMKSYFEIANEWANSTPYARPSPPPTPKSFKSWNLSQIAEHRSQSSRSIGSIDSAPLGDIDEPKTPTHSMPSPPRWVENMSEGGAYLYGEIYRQIKEQDQERKRKRKGIKTPSGALDSSQNSSVTGSPIVRAYREGSPSSRKSSSVGSFGYIPLATSPSMSGSPSRRSLSSGSGSTHSSRTSCTDPNCSQCDSSSSSQSSGQSRSRTKSRTPPRGASPTAQRQRVSSPGNVSMTPLPTPRTSRDRRQPDKMSISGSSSSEED